MTQKNLTKTLARAVQDHFGCSYSTARHYVMKNMDLIRVRKSVGRTSMEEAAIQVCKETGLKVNYDTRLAFLDGEEKET